jgi:DUF1680 family protein
VFCLEGVDHDEPVHAITLERDTTVSEVPDDRTGGVRLHADVRTDISADDVLYSTVPPLFQASRLTAVPYFSWANRGLSDMTVWIRDGGLRACLPNGD